MYFQVIDDYDLGILILIKYKSNDVEDTEVALHAHDVDNTQLAVGDVHAKVWGKGKAIQIGV